MSDESFSTYDAKARFSEVLRRVRAGRTVTITYHGEPVAEIRPIDRGEGTAARVEWLRSRGVLVSTESKEERGGWRATPLARRPGALERFLEEREG